MLWSRTLWSSNDVLWRPELLWSSLFQPEPLSDASFISYENKFRCGTCVQIILSDWRSSQKREAYWLTPRLHGESGQILEQTNFLPMRSVFIRTVQILLQIAVLFAVQNLLVSAPRLVEMYGRSGQVFVRICVNGLLENSPTVNIFFVTLCEARRKLRGVKAMYIPALILSPMDRGVWTINRQVVCHFQTIRT